MITPGMLRCACVAAAALVACPSPARAAEAEPEAELAFIAPEALPAGGGDAAAVAALGPETGAAFALARALRGATLLFAAADGTFVDASGRPAALDRFRVVWCHQGDSTSQTAPVYGRAALDALRRRVEAGGGLFLSGAALALAHRLGVEPAQPRTGGPGTDDYRAAIVPVAADHPIFAGLAVEGVMLDASAGGNPRTCRIPITSAGLPAFADFHGTGGPRAGRLLARAPSGENPLVEYTLGAGRIVAMGWRLAHYSDPGNTHRANLERLTSNVLRYLDDANAWRPLHAAAPSTDAALDVPSRREKELEALELAVRDLAATFGGRYPKGGEYLARIEALARNEDASQADIEALRAEALLANPLLDFGTLLLVERGEHQLGLPANWQANSDLPMTGYDNRIAALSPVGPDGALATVFAPEGGRFAGDVDLDWDAGRLLFSMPGANGRWQVHELALRGGAVRELPLITEPDVDNYDACYLSDGSVLFTSTAPFVGVPCVYGSTHVTNAYRQEAGGSIRRLTVDQDHNWCPAVANDGRVIYLRWEYADLPHSNSRRLFVMNPDGTGQAEYYGSSSFFPNSFFYARPVPGHPTMVIGIATGHHGTPRSGRLLLLDPARGRQEASGVVQEIPGRGARVAALIRDNLVDGVWPQFLHPFPLSAKYFLVSAKLAPQLRWGIYLADVFDNLVLIREREGYALLEPVPLAPRPRPPVVPSRIDRGRQDALVLMTDIYAGEGLRGIPRGTVKKLRLISYNYSFRGVGGLLGAVGMDGPWDVKRVLGSVPVEADGSAVFRVPANVPIAVQPLDAEGRALQLMRSWFTGMPGEKLSCVGCHEPQNSSTPNRMTLAARRAPSEIEPWHGPARGFAFAREVQPVLDRHCTECHRGADGPPAGACLDLRGDRMIADWKSGIAGSVSPEVGGKFSVAYADLHRFVRRPGIESDIRMLAPMEFHAGTTELVQILSRGHHGVELDAEDWDRLVTWIDLNAPYHGTWREIAGAAAVAPQAERRRAMHRQYAGADIDEEWIPPAPSARPPAARAQVADAGAGSDAAPRAFDANEARRRQRAGVPNPTRRLDLGDGVALDLVYVPAGEFVMGGAAGSPANERPAALVRIDEPFWMGAAEVTNAQFARFDPAHESRVEPMHGYQFGIRGWPVDRPDQPVVRVSWERAQAFCEWLSGRTGAAAALPTEAQWEYACRAGTATEFWWGTRDDDFAPFANLGDAKLRDFALDTYIEVRLVPNPNRYDDWVPKDDRWNDGAFVSAAAGSYRPNPWGLHDMHGNVWEWTRSAFRPYPYREDAARDAEGEHKVVRGGSWYDRPFRCTSSFRLAYRRYQPVFNVGFRIVVAADNAPARGADAPAPASGAFRIEGSAAAGGLTSIRRAGDADAVEFVRPGQALGEIVLRTRSGTGPWRESSTAASGDVRRDGGGDSTGAGGLRLAYEGPSANERGLPECALDETFEMRGDALVWSVRLRNTGGAAIEIGDLALVLPMHTDYVWDHEETFVRRVFRHACIAGHGSFLYWLPVKGSGSFLVMQPEGGASLEYFTAGGMDYAYGRERFCAFIHSKGAAETDPRGTWRQAHTSRVLAPGEEAAYAFAFRWADSYAGVRELCARNGVDVRVAPGMVVPRDLGARIALRSAHAIEGIECEFPAETHVEPLPAPAQDTRIYKLRFERLGENLVTVRWGGGRAMPLEFFVTLPIETLLKKRAAFIASRQQHRDPSKWYDGLFSLWDRRQPAGRNLLGPDHTGGLHPYMVSGSDDPSNSKCIFLSEKNAAYPDPKEIEALEYFVDRFVWGKHQRTDEEEPHPFGIYGCDSWRQCRLSATGLGSGGRGQERMWRTFDYTTYFALYFNLYRIASQRPDLARAHDAREYLARAYGTARAYFEVPYAIEMKGWALNGWCDWAYKVGNFHEKCLLPLIEALEREGEPEKAARLRGEWEKKVKYMIYDNPWPFASEMPIDSTAYESTYAAGAYALTRGLAPGANLWYDKNLKKWYSHPAIDPAAHARFLARQHAANLACRGVLAPSYWAFGSDFRGCGGGSYTLSYMSQMGGWAVLDHALRFDANPAGDLRLGYASMLSSWALVNAGDAASSFGFWTPGQEHDGAASWGFEPKRFGPVWATAGGMGELPRGAWPVDGEIDHGLAAGVEAACTVVFEDPVFGLLAYGGEAAWEDGRIAVIPRDGVRRRLSVLRGERRLHLCLDRDGFAAERPLVLGPALDGVAFTLEPRAPHAHETVLTIEGLPAGEYTVACGEAARTFAAEARRPSRVALAVEAGAAPKVAIAPVAGGRP